MDLSSLMIFAKRLSDVIDIKESDVTKLISSLTGCLSKYVCGC